MKTNVNAIKVNQKEVFSLANKIRGQKHCDMKTAYAEAKAQIIQKMTAPASPEPVEPVNKAKVTKVSKTAPANIPDSPCGITKDAFVKMLEAGSVKFTYRNRKGVAHTTKGTLSYDLISKRTNILGCKEAKDPESVAFYDRIHGVYCTVKMCDVLEVF